MDELRELSREVGEVQRLVDQMVDARLLVVQKLEGGKGSTVEIVHESLIHGWPTLRRWLDETQEDAALVDSLRTAARQWTQKGRSPGPPVARRYRRRSEEVQEALQGPAVGCRARVPRRGRRATSSRCSKRRRSAVIAGFIGLGVLVIAAMVALVFIQKSRTEATQAGADRDRGPAARRERSQDGGRRQEGSRGRERDDRREAEGSRRRAPRDAGEGARAPGGVDRGGRRQAPVEPRISRRRTSSCRRQLDESKKSEERAKDNAAAAEKSKADAVAAKSEAEALLEAGTGPHQEDAGADRQLDRRRLEVAETLEGDR